MSAVSHTVVLLFALPLNIKQPSYSSVTNEESKNVYVCIVIVVVIVEMQSFPAKFFLRVILCF